MSTDSSSTKTPWLSIVSLGLIFCYNVYNLVVNGTEMTKSSRSMTVLAIVVLGALIVGFGIMTYLNKRKEK